MVELGGASILGVDRKVYPYRPHDPIALAHAPEVFFDGSGEHVVPASVRLALRVLNRRADQQRLVDGVAQLNGGCGRAAQMIHRETGTTSVPGPPDGLSRGAADPRPL